MVGGGRRRGVPGGEKEGAHEGKTQCLCIHREGGIDDVMTLCSSGTPSRL